MKRKISIILIIAATSAFVVSMWLVSAVKADFTKDQNKLIKSANQNQLTKTSLQPNQCATNINGSQNDGSETARCEKIVFAELRQQSSGFDIVTMNEDGTEKMGLLPADLSGLHPKVSRDGRKILIAVSTSGSKNLYVVNSDGGGLIQLTNAAADNGETAAFSPDGAKVFFNRFTDSNGIFNHSIYSINIDGTGLTQISPSGDNFEFFLSLSPDGTKILYTTVIDKGTLQEPYDLYSMNADGTNRLRLTNSTEFQNINNAEFSPDGARILFGASNNTDYRIETMNADGSGRTRLSPLGFFSIHSRFSPDGSKIVYASDGGSGNSILEIYTMNTDGTGVANLTSSAEDESQPRFNLDGTKILFGRDGKLFIMNADGTNKTEIAVIPSGFGLNNFTGAFIDPDGDGIGGSCDNCPLTANGYRMAFSSARDGNYEIYTMNRDGSDVRRLTINSRSDLEPNFNSDGSRIVFTSDRLNSRREIYVMNADGSGVTRLTNTASNNETASFSPDGTKITFISTRDSGTNNVFIMNADGTNQTRLTTNQGFSGHAYNAIFNHDGSRIAFSTQRGSPGNAIWDIFTINPDGTGETRLTTATGEDNNPSYSRDGSRIVFVSKRDGNGEIYAMNSDGTNQIRLTNNAAFDTDPVFTPDGLQIAFFSNRDGDNELYLMNADGSNVTRLTETAAPNTYPSFAPQTDSDGDGIGDACDNCLLGDPTDTDMDGIADACDNCSTVANPNQENNDDDEIGDACDADDDNDKLPDTMDNCPLNFNPDQEDNDTDGIGDECDPDDDDDGVADKTDNCQLIANPNQEDADMDGAGDSCDDSFDVATPTGSEVLVTAPNATVEFSGVKEEGTTSFVSIEPEDLPMGYTLCPTCPAFEITTDAEYTPPVTVCLQVPAALTQQEFLSLRLLHGENGEYVDRTTGHFTDVMRSVCGEVSSLSPFALAFVSPTAATVSIGGRVATADNRAIQNARITLVAPDGTERVANSNTFGYYRFTDVPAGQIYILNIRSKQFVFNPNTKVVNVDEELTDLDWTAESRRR